VLVADLSHYDGVDNERYPAAFRLAERLRTIARAGSLTPGGYRLESALSCHRRPGHRRCPGHLVVARQEVPSEIIWRCSSCKDGGVITGWESSHHDLRPARLFEDAMLPFEVSDDELHLLRGVPGLDRESERLIYSACRDQGTIWLVAHVEECEELVRKVAAAADRCGDRRRRQRLQQFVARFGR